MVHHERGSGRVERIERPDPEPRDGEVVVKVSACGVCRTDLHVVDGELPPGPLPIVPGHEIVGTVEATGEGVDRSLLGRRVGVPWLGSSCGRCRYCRNDHENLCASARYVGYQLDGGYAERVCADARFAFTVPDRYDDVAIAPLMCAGLIGYRAYRAALDSPFPIDHLGLYGFGAAAHLLSQVAVADGRRVYAFTRPGDREGQAFAVELGASWAGGSDEKPPVELDAAILFAPVGALVPAALRAVGPGGTVVCAGIHMSDVPRFPYAILWEERRLRSVANLTRRDATEFLERAPAVPVRARTTPYALEDAGRALDDLRAGRLTGAAVLVP